MKIKSLYQGLVLLILVILISSCITQTKNIREPDELKQAVSSGATSIVFGKILWIEDGEEKKIGQSIFEFFVSPSLLRLEDRSRQWSKIDENGHFVWSLSPGTYVINKMNYRDTWSGNHYFVPQIAFRVPDKGKTYYIGTLKAEFTPERDFIGGLSGKAKFSVEDHDEAHYQVVTDQLSISQQEIEKSLMVHEKGLPRTYDTTAEYHTAMNILNVILRAFSQ